MSRRLPRLPFALLAILAGAGICAPDPAHAAVEERKRPRLLAPAPPPPPEPPSAGERAARVALEAVGTPYRYGGESPAIGFDCSGLVRWSYGRVGIDLPHSSYALNGVGRAVPRDRLEPGDVLVFDGLGHVGLYIGRGRMVHAPQTGRLVEVVRLGSAGYGGRLVGARRIVSI